MMIAYVRVCVCFLHKIRKDQDKRQTIFHIPFSCSKKTVLDGAAIKMRDELLMGSKLNNNV